MRSEENNLVISYIDSLRMTDFVRQKEGITFEVDLYPCLYEPLATSLMYANKNLLSFMNKHTYNILLKNLWLHYIIVEEVFPSISSKYDLTGNGLIVTSVSSAGASTSVNSVKTLDEGNLFTLDLFRTPYGRKAYSILESISHSAIVLL